MADSSTPGMIEGLERLKIPQSSFTLNRRARPPPIDVPDGPEEPRIPLNAMKLHRQESKGGIRGMFNRNKSEKLALASTLEDGPPMSAVSEMTLKTINYESLDKNTILPQQVASPPPVTPSKPLSKPSRMNLRSRPAKESKPSPKPSTKSPSRPTRTSAAWDPPPLFQAYPQAIKHAQVATSTLSADSILRISNHKRNNSLTDYNTISANGDEKEMAAAAKKTEKAKLKHKRQMSGSISKAVMMIVTSGHILQYGSEGNFDRLPEKMMLLGKDSVAFASDVIPGKHWVLQISQSMDAEGKATSDSRSLLSRLAFRGADYRRTATSLLLILDSAEEMDSWIAVVRREIEALGGKKYVSDSVIPRSDEQVAQLRERPSHRYLIQKNPDQFSNPASPSNLSFGPPPWNQISTVGDTSDAISNLDWTHPSVRALTNQQSATNSIVSHDGQTLDELKRNSAQLQRFSYMSSGQRTSLDSSPTRDSLTAFEDTTPKVSIDESHSRPNASAINERRRSMQHASLLLLESQTPKMHRHSTYGGPAATPNFSVPNSSSRRYSTVKTHTILPSMGSASSRSAETVLKGTRKSPPPAIAIARPLSPVADDVSPMQEVMTITPAESPFHTLQQITTSVIDIAPRSPLPLPSPVESSHPQPSGHLLPQPDLGKMDPPSPSHLNFKFPRPVSMVEALREAPDVPSKKVKRNSLAIPDQQMSQKLDHEKERISPLPVIANTKTKLRRPTSMQIRPSFTTGAFAGIQTRVPSKISPPVSSSNQISQANRPSSFAAKERANSPALKPTALPLQRLKQEKSVRDRRSLPFLVGGPPPAPPPSCALPPLPPSSALRNGSSSSMRKSLKT